MEKEYIKLVDKLMCMNMVLCSSLEDVIETTIDDEDYRESDEIIVDMKYLRKRLAYVVESQNKLMEFIKENKIK